MINNITSDDSPFTVTFPVDSNIAGNSKVIVNVTGTGDVDINLPATSGLSGALCEEVVVNVLATTVGTIGVTPAAADAVATNGTGATVSVANTEGTSKTFAVVAEGLWSV